MPTYECDFCGACCRTRPVFVSEADAVREPRIRSEGSVIPLWMQTPAWVHRLFPLPFHEACCFLDAQNRCTVYSTRPEVCRDFRAGSEACQEVRARQGKPPLLPA